MRSKLIVDLSQDNTPIIRVDLIHNEEDLRDKLLKRFFQNLDHTSNWLYAKPDFPVNEVPTTGWVITPISAKGLKYQGVAMLGRVIDSSQDKEKELSSLIGYFAQQYSSLKNEPISVVYKSQDNTGTITYNPDITV